jgi:redox-sensitive bicupin YhaK (pirin superfamily)
VNLPAALKMGAPRYQEVRARDIVAVDRPGTTVRVVAGEVDGVSGPVRDIAARPIYFDVRLDPGVTFRHPVPRGHTAFAYAFEGKGRFGGRQEDALVEAPRMIVFDDGEAIQAQADETSSLRFVLVAGAPFGEPIVPYGPFVMNTEAEIRQALADLRDGTFARA